MFANRKDVVVITCLLAAIPVIVFGVIHIRSSTSSLTQWLPVGDQVRGEYDAYVEEFGVDDFLIVSWEGCSIEDPRLAALESAIHEHIRGGNAGDRRFFERAYSTRSVLDRLTEAPLSLSDSEAIRRMAGYLTNNDGSTAAILIEASEYGAEHQQATLDQLLECASRSSLDPKSLKIGGTIFEAVVIDRESFASLKMFVVPSGICVLLLAIIAVRSIRLVTVMLAIAVLCQTLSVAVLYYTGIGFNAILVLMPTLIYVIVMSSMLHLISYYRQGVRTGVEDPVAWTLRHGWRPTVGASVTTAIGMGSLGLSRIEPVREFGVLAAINVLIALAVTLLTIGPLLRLCGYQKVGQGEKTDSLISPGNKRYCAFLSAHANWIVLAAVGVTSLSGVALGKLTASLNLQEMFLEDSDLIENYRFIESRIGPLINVEVVVSFPKDAGTDRYIQLAILHDIERKLREHQHVHRTNSILTYLPAIDTGGSFKSVTTRGVTVKYIADHLDDFQKDRLIGNDEKMDTYRISAQVTALGGLQYNSIAQELASAVDGLVHHPVLDAEYSVSFTGLTPVIYEAQGQMLTDLVNSFAGAFALITPLMMLQLRSFLGGLVAMLPNLLPVCIVFGTLGWWGTPVNIGTILTACVGLGIAVDGTLHFLNWFRSQVSTGASVEDAVASTLATCAPAMIHTTLIVGLGLLIYAMSGFVPTAMFAWLLLSLLLIALGADLLITPALILSCLSRLFMARLDEPPMGMPSK